MASPSGQKLKISEREHVSKILTSYVLWQMGIKVTEVDNSVWRLLAEKLGLTVDEIDAAKLEHPENPGYGVVMVWSRRQHSTIGVLRKTLADELKRDDLVQMLDTARQSKLSSACRVIHNNYCNYYSTKEVMFQPPFVRLFAYK